MVLKIGVLLGDDIGPEVVPEAVKVMQAAAAKCGLDVAWSEHPIGRLGHDLHGHTMPEVTVRALEQTDGFLCGPIGHGAYPRNDPTWSMAVIEGPDGQGAWLGAPLDLEASFSPRVPPLPDAPPIPPEATIRMPAPWRFLFRNRPIIGPWPPSCPQAGAWFNDQRASGLSDVAHRQLTGESWC